STLPTTQGQEAQYLLEIIDETGAPLPGVVVVNAEQQLLAESDINGQAEILDGVAQDDTIHFQLLGYLGISGTPASMGWEMGQLQQIVMLEATQLLNPAVVVGRRNDLAHDLPYRVEIIGQEDITLLQSTNTADALADLSGVYVQKSQLGGGSPVVRGLEANRVLLVVDGVRMNNAIYRGGHLQNAVTVDVNALNRLELIYGPGSLAYGSDALGGVVHFRTQDPSFSQGKKSPELTGNLDVGSAANSVKTSWQATYGGQRLAGLTQVSFIRLGDLLAGNWRPAEYPTFGSRPFYLARVNEQDSLVTNKQPDRQIASGYRQVDVLQKLRWQLREKVELRINLQASTSSDIPRYDQLIEEQEGDLRWAEWAYGPQTRLLASLRLDDRRTTSFYDLSSVLISQQFIAEDRIQRRVGNPERETSEVDVYATNLQWDLAKSFGIGQRLNYGIDGRFDDVRSVAHRLHLETGLSTTEGIATRYPSQGSSLGSIGAYVDYRQKLGDYFNLQGGLRYSYQWLTARFGENDPIAWPQAYLDGITNYEGALTTALSLGYERHNQRIKVLFAQGFRAPNVDDYAKFRERNGFIQVPNPDLGSERSNSLEARYRVEKENWAFNVGVFYSWLNNVIVRQDFLLPDGADFFVSFGDTLRVQANVNAERARIYGFDIDYRHQLGKHFRFVTDFHWLRGRRQQLADDGNVLNLPQDHIPPPYGRLELRYARKVTELRIRFRYQFAKAVEDYAVGAIIPVNGEGYILDRTGTSDNLELTPIDPNTGEFAGTYAWWTLNFNGQLQISPNMQIRLGMENIFDRHYRPFASGISAPGRNILLGISWTSKKN
ncbi:MAG: TonB-dependent receptor, partial [Bacteroidota bacterium]